MKKQLISATTVAMFLTTVVAQPLTTFAESGDIIEQTRQKVEEAQKNYPPQNPYPTPQQTVSPSGTVDLNRITVYDAETGNLVTVIQNSAGQVTAFDQSGQQVAVKPEWTKNLPVVPTTLPTTTGGIVGTTTIGSTNISPSKTQQLSSILSAIKADGNLGTFGKIAKALLALEAIKANNQIMQRQVAAQQKKTQEKAQQPTTQQPEKAAEKTPVKKNNVPAEYAGTLRDTEAETGGERKVVAVEAIGDIEQESRLPVDLVGQVTSIEGNTLSVQGADGQVVAVEMEDPENYTEGDYLNASGNVLSGDDGNIYVVQDPENNLDMNVSKIDQDAYKQKLAEQEQAAQEFAQENPSLAGYSGTGAAGNYYAPESEDDSSVAGNTDTNYSNYTGEDDSSVVSADSQYVEGADDESWTDKAKNTYMNGTRWVKDHRFQILGGISVAAGVVLVTTATATGAATAATGAGPVLATYQGKFGLGLITGGIGMIGMETYKQDITEKIEEDNNAKMEEYQEQGDAIKAKADAIKANAEKERAEIIAEYNRQRQ